MCQRIGTTAGALRGWGMGRGERVAILSENRVEWTIADFASLLLGAVTVPVYATLTAEQTAYILRDSGARVIFVSTETQMQKVLSIREQTAVEKIVVMDAVESAGAVQMQELAPENCQGLCNPIPRWRRALAPSCPMIWLPSSTLLEPPAPPRE